MGYYSVNDYAGFAPSNLPDKVLSVLTYLENELKKHAADEPPSTMSSHTMGHNNNQRDTHAPSRRQAPQHTIVRKSNGYRGSKQSSANVSAADWEALRSFKPTKKPETVEGSDKTINDIRMMLNKITQKTYETLKISVINGIGECIQKFPDETTLSKLSKHFFDIVVRDRFLTDIYVDLYLALIAFFPVFEDYFKKRVDTYRATIDTMQYADPEKDYDAYCDYVKVNDQRKAMTLFIIQLFKRERLSSIEIIDLMKFLLDKTIENRSMNGRTNEVDEITENFYLTYLHCGVLLEREEEWSKSIVPAVRAYSAITIGSYPSLSSRALLKYQDMVESLDIDDL